MSPARFGLLIGVALFGFGAAPPPAFDLLIRGGTIFTGEDAPYVGDVAVTGDRINAVGRRLRPAARQIIDARGMIVAPGFIDPHTHSGAQLAAPDAATRLMPAYLMQGVTTIFIGNDGGGDPDIAAVLGRGSAVPVGVNYAAYVGFGAVRKQVIGDADRAPSAAELDRMKRLVASAMCQGSLGLSTSLFYAPQSFARTEEVVEVAREAGVRGGVYDTHLRDESSYSIGLAAAVDEAIAIGRHARMPVNISHIKALGVDVHGQAPAIVAKVEAARRAGERVTADQYPWSASGTTLVAALVPPWAQDGGRGAMLRRFGEPASVVRLRADMAENLRRRGGAAAMLITEGANRGRTLADIAGERDPVATAIAVIEISDPAVASFNQTEADIEAFMRQPWVMTASDASGGHPRAYGSFARKYSEYVVARKVLTLREFIERSTRLTADTFGLSGRGRLKRGSYADIIMFDPKRYAARATYEQPTLLAAGVVAVVVNGVVAVEEGAMTGAAAGRALPRKPGRGNC